MTDSPDEFQKLKAEIEKYPRLCGYYLIKWLDLIPLRASGLKDELLLDAVFQQLDDQPWPSKEQRPKDQSWSDYEVLQSEAMAHAIEVLGGGPPVGHLKHAIALGKAQEFAERFDTWFQSPKRYFSHMGFGDSKFVFCRGIAIVSRAAAGLLWVAESE